MYSGNSGQGSIGMLCMTLFQIKTSAWRCINSPKPCIRACGKSLLEDPSLDIAEDCGLNSSAYIAFWALMMMMMILGGKGYGVESSVQTSWLSSLLLAVVCANASKLQQKHKGASRGPVTPA